MSTFEMIAFPLLTSKTLATEGTAPVVCSAQIANPSRVASTRLGHVNAVRAVLTFVPFVSGFGLRGDVNVGS